MPHPIIPADPIGAAHDVLDMLFLHREDVRQSFLGGENTCECDWCSRLAIVLAQLDVVWNEPKATAWMKVVA
jgi:hypothetical protein